MTVESASFWLKTKKPAKVDSLIGSNDMRLVIITRDAAPLCHDNVLPLLRVFVADVDECQTETSNCAHGCHNTLGSYVCVCNAAYELGSDGKQCYSVFRVQKRLLSHLTFTGSRCLF